MNDDASQTVEPTVLTRDYDAPLQMVFDAWTKPEHLQRWQVPFKGFQFEFAHVDIRPGGSSLHKMTAPNGFEMWLKTEYVSITPPDELVFIQYTSDAQGAFVPNPQMPDWPRDMQTTIRLEKVDGMTRLHLIWQPINSTPAQILAFEASRPEHGKGWGAGLEQLAAYLQGQ